MAEVKKRGNWKQDRSVARYEKAARLNATMMTYSLPLQAYLHRCAGLAEAAFRGSLRDSLIRHTLEWAVCRRLVFEVGDMCAAREVCQCECSYMGCATRSPQR